jgi:hypothetical protein
MAQSLRCCWPGVELRLGRSRKSPRPLSGRSLRECVRAVLRVNKECRRRRPALAKCQRTGLLGVELRNLLQFGKAPGVRQVRRSPGKGSGAEHRLSLQTTLELSRKRPSQHRLLFSRRSKRRSMMADDGLPTVSAWNYPLRSLPRVSLSASSERSKTCPALPCLN